MQSGKIAPTLLRMPTSCPLYMGAIRESSALFVPNLRACVLGLEFWRVNDFVIGLGRVALLGYRQRVEQRVVPLKGVGTQMRVPLRHFGALVAEHFLEAEEVTTSHHPVAGEGRS